MTYDITNRSDEGLAIDLEYFREGIAEMEDSIDEAQADAEAESARLNNLILGVEEDMVDIEQEQERRDISRAVAQRERMMSALDDGGPTRIKLRGFETRTEQEINAARTKEKCDAYEAALFVIADYWGVEKATSKATSVDLARTVLRRFV